MPKHKHSRDARDGRGVGRRVGERPSEGGKQREEGEEVREGRVGWGVCVFSLFLPIAPLSALLTLNVSRIFHHTMHDAQT